uniref:DUF2911 domain-containing protein n=2 Tax=Paracidobacterium acidisoli TaxID=2303751 RepID=A0A372INI7_9BACT
MVGTASAQKAPPSPARTATATIDGQTLTIKYSAPSVRGRQIFGPGGLVSHDRTAPVWRAGANAATSFHTDADLDLGGLSVPKGDYTLFADVQDPDHWTLVVNKQTGQWGLTYNASQDLGRVKMEMSTPPSLVETLYYSIQDKGGSKGVLQLAWEHHVASVPFTVK